MNRLLVFGAAVIGSILAFRSLMPGPGRRLGSALSGRMLRHMQHMMANLPEGSPPKLVMSVLPRLRDQNDRVIAMLEEQNRLLREYLERTP